VAERKKINNNDTEMPDEKSWSTVQYFLLKEPTKIKKINSDKTKLGTYDHPMYKI
jgi:ABC-type uncharacterized transport system substrate-binding protein